MEQDKSLYVTNEQLSLALLQSHYEGHLTYECMRLFRNIITMRVHRYLKYNKDEHELAMIEFCEAKVCRVWHSFRFKDRDKPFAYFVTIIDNSIKLYFMKNQLQFTSIEAQNARFDD